MMTASLRYWTTNEGTYDWIWELWEGFVEVPVFLEIWKLLLIVVGAIEHSVTCVDSKGRIEMRKHIPTNGQWAWLVWKREVILLHQCIVIDNSKLNQISAKQCDMRDICNGTYRVWSSVAMHVGQHLWADFLSPYGVLITWLQLPCSLTLGKSSPRLLQPFYLESYKRQVLLPDAIDGQHHSYYLLIWPRLNTQIGLSLENMHCIRDGRLLELYVKYPVKM